MRYMRAQIACAGAQGPRAIGIDEIAVRKVAHSGEFGTGSRSKPAGVHAANRQPDTLQTGTASVPNRQVITLQTGGNRARS
jgi:hypothetical protein